TASAGGTIATTKIIVLPANGVSLFSFAAQQGIFRSGTPQYWTPVPGSMPTWESSQVFVANLNLTGPAPAGGATVTITGARLNTMQVVDASSGAATTTITIPAGLSAYTFSGRVYAFTGNSRGVRLTATYGGITRSQDFLLPSVQQAVAVERSAVRCAAL